VKKKNPHKIFDRAYDKAARMRAGDKNLLTPVEEKVLHRYIYRDRQLRNRGRGGL